MLNIFARSFMTATRTEDTLPIRKDDDKRRWLPEGHWWKIDERKKG